MEQQLLHLGFLEVFGKVAVDRQGDFPSLFGNHKGDGIGYLGDTKSCPVTGADPPRKVGILGEGKVAARGDNVVPVYDDGSVVEGVSLPKYGDKEFLGDIGVQLDGRSPEILQSCVPFKHDESADLLSLERAEGPGDFVAEEFGFLACFFPLPQAPAPSELLEHFPQLGLEDDRNGDDQNSQNLSQKP